jgi:hypothetical protein
MKALRIFFIWCFPLVAFADLAIAKKFFETGDYEKALKELEADLLPVSKLGSKEADIEGYKILGASYLLNKTPDKGKAKSAFDSVLRLDPDATLDTLRFSPEVVSVFNDVKKDIANNQLLVTRKTNVRRMGQGVSTGLELLKRQKDLTPKYYAVVIQQQSPALSFIPIAGQLQNNQPAKAFIFLGAEALFLGTAAGTFINLQNITEDTNGDGIPECRVEDPNPKGGLSADQLCQLSRRVNLLSSSLAIVTLGVAAYDSRIHFTPTRYELKEVPPEVGRFLQKQVSQIQLAPSFDLGSPGLKIMGNF